MKRDEMINVAMDLWIKYYEECDQYSDWSGAYYWEFSGNLQEDIHSYAESIGIPIDIVMEARKKVYEYRRGETSRLDPGKFEEGHTGTFLPNRTVEGDQANAEARRQREDLLKYVVPKAARPNPGLPGEGLTMESFEALHQRYAMEADHRYQRNSREIGYCEQHQRPKEIHWSVEKAPEIGAPGAPIGDESSYSPYHAYAKALLVVWHEKLSAVIDDESFWVGRGRVSCASCDEESGKRAQCTC